MKKNCITLGIIIIIFLTVTLGGCTFSQNQSESSYLRIHIRANSNSPCDQEIKYEIKDCLVNFLTPTVAECKSKSEAISRLNTKKASIKKVLDEYLTSRGFSYKSAVKIKREQFPTRVYEDLTLNAGFYDAVIVELGDGKGDNWWCVVYPPLCFTSSENVKYRSKIIDIINQFKEKHQKT